MEVVVVIGPDGQAIAWPGSPTRAATLASAVGPEELGSVVARGGWGFVIPHRRRVTASYWFGDTDEVRTSAATGYKAHD